MKKINDFVLSKIYPNINKLPLLAWLTTLAVAILISILFASLLLYYVLKINRIVKDEFDANSEFNLKKGEEENLLLLLKREYEKRQVIWENAWYNASQPLEQTVKQNLNTNQYNE